MTLLRVMDTKQITFMKAEVSGKTCGLIVWFSTTRWKAKGVDTCWYLRICEMQDFLQNSDRVRESLLLKYPWYPWPKRKPRWFSKPIPFDRSCWQLTEDTIAGASMRPGRDVFGLHPQVTWPAESSWKFVKTPFDLIYMNVAQNLSGVLWVEKTIKGKKNDNISQ